MTLLNRLDIDLKYVLEKLLHKHFKWFIANFYDTDRICEIWGIDCEAVGGCGLIQFRAQNIVDCYIGGIGNSINFGDDLQVVPVYLVMIVKNPIGIWCV